MKNNKKESNKNIVNNLSKNKQQISLSDKIDIVLAFISFLSLIAVMLTLGEMVRERNATYEPSILINPIEYNFEWNENGIENWLKFSDVTKDEHKKTSKDNVIEGNISIPMTILSEGELEKLSIVNVGVGTARDVVFEWSEDNLIKLNQFLIQCDETKKDFFKIDKSVTFSFKQGLLITYPPNSSRLMYMLANAQETYNIYLPSAYSVLIHEIIKTNKHNNDIPPLILTATYFDVQGEEKTEEFLMNINKVSYQQEDSGAGNSTYQLIPGISKS